MAVLALALGWIAWDGALVFWRALAMGRAIEVRTGVGAAAVGAVQLGLLVALLLRRSSSAQKSLFRAVLWLAPLLLLVPLALLLATGALLPEKGYARCPPLSGQRFLTVLWAPAGTACPS